MKIAITGGIGSGKSLVCRMIKDAGYPVFSCDEIYKEIQNDPDYLSALERSFGDVVKNNAPDRKKLAAMVFFDAEKLKQLNAIAHPLIMKTLYGRMEQYPVAFAEVPLLFESRCQTDFDKVIVVYRDFYKRIKAVCLRDGLTEKEVLARIKNQADYEKIIKEGHTVIYNDGDAKSLKENVERTLEKIFA